MQILPATADYLHRYEEIHRCKSSREDDAVDPSLRCVGSGNGVRSDFSDGLPSPIQHSGAPLKPAPTMTTRVCVRPTVTITLCPFTIATLCLLKDRVSMTGPYFKVVAFSSAHPLTAPRGPSWAWCRRGNRVGIGQGRNRAVPLPGPFARLAPQRIQRDLLAPERPRIAREEWPGVNKPR